MRARRTIHLFAPQLPPRALLDEALRLACWAPNHRVTEPWRFYVLGPQTAEAVARLNAEIVAEKHGSKAARAKLERWQSMPGWLVVTSRKADDLLTTQENYAACCCAVQNMQLYLWSEGVGMKWGTGKVTRHPRFFELLGIDPAQEQVVGLFWYGYPAVVPQAQRRPLEAFVEALP